MSRFLAFVGAVALATGQPAAALAHPAGSTIPRAPIPASGVSAHGASASAGFKAPIGPAVQLKPLQQPHQFAPLARFYPPALPAIQRRYSWQRIPGYLLLTPAFFGSQCFASNGYASSPNEQPPFGFTLGSLDDGKANLLSPSSFNRSVFTASGISSADDSSNPFSVETGFRASCGTWNFPAF